jgi:hypothetical protein
MVEVRKPDNRFSESGWAFHRTKYAANLAACTRTAWRTFGPCWKRTLKGTYVSVDPAHLQSYTDEQCFRFNTRKMTDAERFAVVMQQIVRKRITYNELIGKTSFEVVEPEMRP